MYEGGKFVTRIVFQTRSLQFRTPPTHGTCPMCRAAISLFTTVTLSDDTPLRKPECDTIFGQVCVSLSSLSLFLSLSLSHFLSPTHSLSLSRSLAFSPPPQSRSYSLSRLVFEIYV